MKSELQSPLIPTGGQSDLSPPSDLTPAPPDDNNQAKIPLTLSIVHLPSSNNLQVQSGDSNGDEKELASVPTDDNKKADVPLTIPIVHLPTSGSLQIESDDVGGNATEPVYQLFEEREKFTALDAFLASLGITQQHLNSASISPTALQQLYRQEFSRLSGWKWSSFDHLVEKTLQWPLLSPADIGISDSKRCEYRIRPQERSLLLNSTWGLVKAYAVRGFVQGVEISLLESTHYFIYAMLAYRLVELLQTGHTQFKDFQDIFRGSSQKGIDSLVQSLVKIEAKWLKLILATPFLIGALQSIAAMYSARSISTETRQETFTQIKTRLIPESDCQHSLLLEKIPVLNQRALGNQIQKLERWVRWDGRLDRHSRKQAFELIRRTAWAGKKVTQLKVLESLAKIAHGIGLKDFPRLQRAGRPTEELVELLWMKTTALFDLELLAKQKSARHTQFNPQQRTTSIAALPRRFYASYLLWWLGQSTSWWRQQLPFALLKIVKLGLEVLFLQKIINSIIEAINCPDKPGYQFGNGYQDWASDYTATCFTKRVSFFRTININESMDDLILEIPKYHLAELSELKLSSKRLTTDETSKFIQAVINQGASLLKMLDLSSNQLNTIADGLFTDLNNLEILHLDDNHLYSLNKSSFADLSQLKQLSLSMNELIDLSNDVFIDLNQLTFLDLSFNGGLDTSIKIYSNLKNLEELYLDFTLFSDPSCNCFSNLINLKYLSLSETFLTNPNETLFSNIKNLETLDISYNQLAGLSKEIFSSLANLKTLNIGSSRINTSTFIDFLSLLPQSLTSLDFSSNLLSSLPSDFSQELPSSIRELYIGGNPFIPNILTKEFMNYFPITLTILGIGGGNVVRNITENTFMKFSLLETLMLDNNQLTYLYKGVFSGLENLKQLDLGYNALAELDEGVFSNLNQLKSLSLVYNQLGQLDEVFSGLYQLEDLNLFGNRLEVVDEKMFADLSNLKTLILYFNKIYSLDEKTFSNLIYLQELSLDANLLMNLPNELFLGLSRLHYLSLYNNRLQSIDENLFVDLTQLQRLTLTSNKLSNLSAGIFTVLNQLQRLDLGDNQLSSETIKNLTAIFPYQLYILDISNNQITSMQPLAEILSCTNLTNLNVNGNPLNDTSIALEIQKNNLKKLCDDQRCHANLPASESCQVSIYSADGLTEADKIAWKMSDFLGGFITDKMRSLPNFALSSTAGSSQVDPVAAVGTIILGLTLSALLYKNSTWFHSIVDAGCHVLQRCWNKGRAVTIRKVSLFHCCPTVFSRVSTITRQRSLPLIAETNRLSQNLV